MPVIDKILLFCIAITTSVCTLTFYMTTVWLFAQPDEDDSPLLEGAMPSLLQGDSGETGSISSAEGILGDRPRKKYVQY